MSAHGPPPLPEQVISFDEAKQLRERHIGASCKLFFRADPLRMVSASGQYMYDCRGQAYLDCINNVCHVGHCHPKVVKAAQDQMAILNTNSRFLHNDRLIYVERLCSKFHPSLSVAFLVNSGSEANDLALRLAHQHTGQKDVIVLDHAYHGHVSSLIDISPYKFNKPGGSGCPEFTSVAPCPDMYRGKYTDRDHEEKEMGLLYAKEVEDICVNLEAKGRKPSAFIAESMQSCGGQLIYPDNYLAEVCKIVRSRGGVVIADEVQVGFGRVGSHMWAYETYGGDVVPDIVTLGKPMGNGHPIAAVITTVQIAKSFNATGIEYFNTYGGNPVSCAVGLAVLDVIEEENLMEHATKVGNKLKKAAVQLAEKHPIIGQVRGRGMFFGIDLVKDRETREPNTAAAAHITSSLRSKKILIQSDGPHDNVLKFKSPLTFTEENVDTLMEELDKLFTEVEEADL